jgi:hypothetical protein
MMSLTKRWLEEQGEAGAADMPVIFAYTDVMALDDGQFVNIESLAMSRLRHAAPLSRLLQAGPHEPSAAETITGH